MPWARKQREAALDRERPAPANQCGAAERQGARGLDRAHQEPQIEPGERVEVALPDGKEDAAPELRWSPGGLREVRDLDPAVAGLGLPGWAQQAQARHLGLPAGLLGMGADLARERMVAASITRSMARSRRNPARPATPPKPPLRTSPGGRIGLRVRPASELMTSKLRCAEHASASATASAVPPRIRTRDTRAIACFE